MVAVILAKLTQEFWPELMVVAAEDEAGPLPRRLAEIPEGHWFYARAQTLLQTMPKEVQVAPSAEPAAPPQVTPAAPPPEPVATAAPEPRAFPDVPMGHWAAAAVTRLQAEGIVEGYPGGKFGGGG